MKIGVDLDGVLSQTIPAVIAFHNETYGTHLTFENFFSNNYWDVWGGTLPEALEKVFAFHKTAYFENIQPVVGAQEALVRLKEKHELYIITARPYRIVEETKKWVERYFPNIFSEIYFTSHFTKDADTRTKKEVCDSLGLDIMIEDVIEHATECVTPERKVFLIDYPWNQSTALPQNITRVYSWEEIVKAIQ